jgi:hypothetical protein
MSFHLGGVLKLGFTSSFVPISVKQYTKLLQVLTKQEEGDMQPAKISDSQNCTKRLPGVDTKHVQKFVEL